MKELLGNRCRWTEASQLMARARLYFNGPTFSLLPKNQDQYAADLRRTFEASRRLNLSRLLGASPCEPDAPLQLTDDMRLVETVRVSVRVLEAAPPRESHPSRMPLRMVRIIKQNQSQP